MDEKTGRIVNSRCARALVVVVTITAIAIGCAQLRELIAPTAPGMTDKWAELLVELRAFERRIGFADTRNFAGLSREQEEYPFCGYASRLSLPYSYEDPAIKWLESVPEEECRARGHDADVFFATVEAWGEIGTPVTPAMITGKLDRFIYVVIHEDCHDQFGLPYGVEEALCNLITYKGMAAFADEKYGHGARVARAIRRYAEAQSKITRMTITYYAQLATLYARYQRREISADALLRARAVVFVRAEKSLDWPKGSLNNVGIANHMTYSRHYPFLESVFDALGHDLTRTVAFFRHVDKVKPSKADILKRNRIANEESVDFVRAYEAAMVETIRSELANAGKVAKTN